MTRPAAVSATSTSRKQPRALSHAERHENVAGEKHQEVEETSKRFRVR